MVKKDIKKSDYELSRAGFSATMGLGIMALIVATKDTNQSIDFWSRLFLTLAMWTIATMFWTRTIYHYNLHFKYRKISGISWKIWEYF